MLSGWDITESHSNVCQHFLALHKEWSCRKEGGSTTYWPECAARDKKTVNTSSKHKDQGTATDCKKEKVNCLDNNSCSHSDVKKNKSTPRQYCSQEKHCQSCKPFYNCFAELQVMRIPVPRGAWTRSLDFLLSVNKGNLTAPFVGWQCRVHRLNYSLGNSFNRKGFPCAWRPGWHKKALLMLLLFSR